MFPDDTKYVDGEITRQGDIGVSGFSSFCTAFVSALLFLVKGKGASGRGSADT